MLDTRDRLEDRKYKEINELCLKIISYLDTEKDWEILSKYPGKLIFLTSKKDSFHKYEIEIDPRYRHNNYIYLLIRDCSTLFKKQHIPGGWRLINLDHYGIKRNHFIIRFNLNEKFQISLWLLEQLKEITRVKV